MACLNSSIKRIEPLIDSEHASRLLLGVEQEDCESLGPSMRKRLMSGEAPEIKGFELCPVSSEIVRDIPQSRILILLHRSED